MLDSVTVWQEQNYSSKSKSGLQEQDGIDGSLNSQDSSKRHKNEEDDNSKVDNNTPKDAASKVAEENEIAIKISETKA